MNSTNRSEQVNDILEEAPNWMIRWGITLIFGVLILIIIGTGLISYNDTVNAKVTIATKISPTYIKAKTIVPQQPNKLVGKLNIPIRSSKRIKIGQEVIIKLHDYPYEEWGSLSGKIVSISEIPRKRDTTYTAYIKIDSLITSLQKKIVLKKEMRGSAEIISEKLTILERIFPPLNDIISEEGSLL